MIYRLYIAMVLTKIYEDQPGLLSEIDTHDPAHKINILKKIISVFSSIKLKHMYKLDNQQLAASSQE